MTSVAIRVIFSEGCFPSMVQAEKSSLPSRVSALSTCVTNLYLDKTRQELSWTKQEEPHSTHTGITHGETGTIPLGRIRTQIHGPFQELASEAKTSNDALQLVEVNCIVWSRFLVSCQQGHHSTGDHINFLAINTCVFSNDEISAHLFSAPSPHETVALASTCSLHLWGERIA
jgi:hypothetical protein